MRGQKLMCRPLRPLAVLLAIAAFGAPATHAFANTYNLLEAFCQAGGKCKNGSGPSAGLVMDAAGNLYGVTSGGGRNNSGEVYELVHNLDNSWTQVILHSFATCTAGGCPEGCQPLGNLILDSSGNLYGTTSKGGLNAFGATAFELKPNLTHTKWTLSLLHTFCVYGSNCSDGSFSRAGLAYAGQSAGQAYDGVSPLFGTMYQGGVFGHGTVFELKYVPKSAKWREITVYTFCSLSNCADGDRPAGNVVVSGKSTLYGTTQYGGQSSNGAVFALNPAVGGGWSLKVMYSFCQVVNCADGEQPVAGLMIGSHGNLYGTTPAGGKGGSGTVFKLSSGGSESVLHSFCARRNCADGAAPMASPIMDSSGNLFGTTQSGGANNHGTVFEIGTSMQVLYSFCGQVNCPDGASPIAPLALDGSGDLFGTTNLGGNGPPGGAGVAFELTP
ncbi:MAG TPA: choice-of-anchor tandem repeat GloVer-containing protein [Rhizomicrobium sp.]